MIGPYRLVAFLGAGGLGMVYLAEQIRPVRPQVARKIIKAGTDSKRVMARLGAQPRTLARIEHPPIARVYGTGRTPNGPPYFVREYLKGLPITRPCDQHTLTREQRLDLFLHVGAAVPYAHEKGILPRDLKPSHILVTIEDQEMIPKIVDFGITHAMNQSLTQGTPHAEKGDLIGAPE